MADRGMNPTLRLIVEEGLYEVDSRAVAEAIVRSGVLVPGEPGDGTVGAEQDEAAAA